MESSASSDPSEKTDTIPSTPFTNASANAKTDTIADPNLHPKPQPRTSTGCIVVAGILGLALVASALIVASALRDGFTLFNTAAEKVIENNPANVIATALPPPTPTIVVRPPTLRQVKSLAGLTTLSAMMSTVVEANVQRVGSLVNERLLLVACGKVNAGVDLSQITEDDIALSADGKTVTVRLPRSEITDVFLIDDSKQPCTTKVYDRTNLIVLPETKELEGQAREKAVQAIRDTAIQSGLLDEANKNARNVVEKMLLLLGYEKVVFVED
jgi:hypothetical protein